MDGEYKIKVDAEKEYRKEVFLDAISATQFALELFTGNPISIYHKKKYHKLKMKITHENEWRIKVRTGVIVASKPTKLDFFNLMFS